MTTRYRMDPYWLTTRYPGECSHCGSPIPKGSPAWYYPKGKRLNCEPCGRPMAAEFEAAAWDEDRYSGRGW
jgi:hypothetical protein